MLGEPQEDGVAPAPEGGEEADEGELGMDLHKSKKKKKKKVRSSCGARISNAVESGILTSANRTQSSTTGIKCGKHGTDRVSYISTRRQRLPR